MECACTNAAGGTQYLFLVAPLLLGLICYKAAASKGRNRWVWGIVGFLIPLAGLLAVALLPRIKPAEDAA